MTDFLIKSAVENIIKSFFRIEARRRVIFFLKNGTWTTAGNSRTITDSDVVSTSLIVIQHTSAHNGLWHVVVASAGGSFVVYSSVLEDGSPTFNYMIL